MSRYVPDLVFKRAYFEAALTPIETVTSVTGYTYKGIEQELAEVVCVRLNLPAWAVHYGECIPISLVADTFRKWRPT